MSEGMRIVPGGRGPDDFRHTGGSGLEVWYAANCIDCFGFTTGAPSLGTLRALPFVAPSRGGVLDRLGYVITATAGTNTRIGLYQSLDDANIYPGALLFDSGNIANSNAVKTATLTAAQGALFPGRLYWIAILSDGASTIRCLNLSNVGPILGCDNTFAGTPNAGISVAFAFAALPATFTAGGAMIQAVPIPALYYRFAS